MFYIKEAAVESIIKASKNVYPNEFFSMLGGEGNIIEELVIVPATFGERFSMYRIDMVPLDRSIIGTIHSHPSPINTPSKADLNAFSKKGKIHLIISYPYELNTIKAFDNNGKEVQLQVI